MQTLPSTTHGTYAFSVEEFHKLGEAGIVGEDDRIELLEGQLTIMSPIGGDHIWAVNTLSRLFQERLAGKCVVSTQNPVRLDRYSEPQPDVTLLRGQFPERKVPTADDVLLLVEIADTSLTYDRNKLKLYARAGIPEVWILNLSQRQVEVYRMPSGGRYAEEEISMEGGVTPRAFPDVAFTVEEILP